MFSNFSMIEMAVIVIVAILVVGPKDLPKMLRGIGKSLGTVKRMAGDFQRQFKDALDDAELDEIKDLANDVDPLKEAKEAMQGIKNTVKDPMETTSETEVKPPVAKSKAKTSKAAPKKAAPKKTAKAKSDTPKTTAKKTVAKKAAPKKAAPKKATAKKTPKPTGAKST